MVMEFPIRPIRSDKELDHAICVLDRLLSRKRALDSQEQGYFDSLSHEIQLYEEASIVMPAVSGADMLRHLIDAREATMTDVAVQTGIAVSTISAVLGGKRKLNRNHIENPGPLLRCRPGCVFELMVPPGATFLKDRRINHSCSQRYKKR